MKNTLYHFGDSFSLAKNHFVSLISKKININYELLGISGSSNHQIFSEILKNDFRFEAGDIIFVNWSFLHRGCYVNKGKIESTNIFFDEVSNTRLEGEDYYETFCKEHLFILDYTLNNSYDINIKLFDGMVSPYFNSLKHRGIKTYNLFINESENLYYNTKVIKNNGNLINLDNIIKFEPSFYHWLLDNGYMKQQDVHYTFGVQNIIADVVFNKMNNL